jgi:hypothetical protein
LVIYRIWNDADVSHGYRIFPAKPPVQKEIISPIRGKMFQPKDLGKIKILRQSKDGRQYIVRREGSIKTEPIPYESMEFYWKLDYPSNPQDYEMSQLMMVCPSVVWDGQNPTLSKIQDMFPLFQLLMDFDLGTLIFKIEGRTCYLVGPQERLVKLPWGFPLVVNDLDTVKMFPNLQEDEIYPRLHVKIS